MAEAFEALVEEGVVFAHDVFEEDVGALAAELERDRDEVLRGVLHDEAAGGGFAGEGDLFDARAGGEGLACLKAEAVDDVEDAGGQDVFDQPIRTRMESGVCSAGLRTMQLPAARAGASFQVAMRMGKFHGMIWPTTPRGSW